MDNIEAGLIGVAAGFFAGASLVGAMAYRAISRITLERDEAWHGFATAERLRAQDRYARAGVLDHHPFVAKPVIMASLAGRRVALRHPDRAAPRRDPANIQAEVRHD